MADRNPKVLINDGEGVDHTDFNRLQALLEKKVYEQAMRTAAMVGNYQSMGDADSNGMDIFGDARSQGSSLTSHMFIHNPLTGFRDDTKVAAGNMFFESFIYSQIKETTHTPGTQPTDASNLMTFIGDDEEREYDADLATDTPPVGGNPRWDTLFARLGWEEGNAVSRDFKDAVTGALSTTTPNKDFRHSLEWSHVQGPQQVAYTHAVKPNGYAPIITKRRPVGDAAPYDRDDFYYHVFPTRMATEDISGQDLMPVGGFGGQWDVDTLGLGSMEAQAGAAGTLYALPRNMHAGCRLIGVSIILTSVTFG